MTYIPREITKNILEGLQSMPAVFVNGPRQAGKSTLTAKISKNELDAEYVTFDDVSILASARYNPQGFLQSFKKTVVIDEVQMAPEIFRQLKKIIDNRRVAGENVNGKYLLTGSSNINTVPELSEALVGRVMLIPLFPFSSGEIAQSTGNIVRSVFEDTFSFQNLATVKYSLKDMIRKATFPEISLNKDINVNRWFESYINTLLYRDLRNISQVEKLYELPNLLKVLAAQAGGLLNDASLARATRLNQMTLRRYRMLLQNVFLTMFVPPWFGNIKKRLVKAPKIYFTDTLMLTHLLGYDIETMESLNPVLWGFVVENFVASELSKKLSLAEDGKLYHFRTSDDKEVDFVIEKRNGEIAGFEVKNSSSVDISDFKGLKFLQSLVKDKFIRGVVLYRGNKILPFDKKLIAMPIDLIWSSNSGFTI